MSETKRTLKDLIPVDLVIQATQEARRLLDEQSFLTPPGELDRVAGLIHRLDHEVPTLPGGFETAKALLCEAAYVDPDEVLRHASIVCKPLPIFTAIFFNGLTKPGPLQNGDLLVLLDPESGICMKHDGTVVPEQIIELPKKLGRLATTQEIAYRLSGIAMSDSVAAALEEIATEPLPGDALETIPAPATVEQVFPPWYVVIPFGKDGKDLAESHRAEIEAKAGHSGKVDLFRGSWSVMIPAISRGDAEVILAKVDSWSGIVRPNPFTPAVSATVQPLAAIVEMPPSSDFGPKPPVAPALDRPISEDEKKAMTADHAAMTGMSIEDAAKDLGFDTGAKKNDLSF